MIKVDRYTCGQHAFFSLHNEYILEKGSPVGAYICIAIGIVFMFLFFLVKIGVLNI